MELKQLQSNYRLQTTLSQNSQEARFKKSLRCQKRVERKKTVERVKEEWENNSLNLKDKITSDYERSQNLKESRENFWNIRKQMRLDTEQ